VQSAGSRPNRYSILPPSRSHYSASTVTSTPVRSAEAYASSPSSMDVSWLRKGRKRQKATRFLPAGRIYMHQSFVCHYVLQVEIRPPYVGPLTWKRPLDTSTIFVKTVGRKPRSIVQVLRMNSLSCTNRVSRNYLECKMGLTRPRLQLRSN